MICIPKPDKLNGYCINAADCRPITIQCFLETVVLHYVPIFWDFLSPQVSGLSGTELYTTIIMIFDQLGSQNYILGMDYTKAFDVLDPQLTQSLLLKLGWPSKLVQLLTMVWSRNKRFICWGHHTHPQPLQGPSMPPGDPWVPLVCSLSCKTLNVYFYVS